MKNKILSFILTAAVISLAGCNSVGLSVDSLMHPPRAVGDKAGIQDLIDSVAGEGYTLKYPEAGSFRSAITIKDIDSDSVDEAIAFYLPQGDIATVHILIMDSFDGQWRAIGDFKSQSTAVESLNFCDLDGDGISEIAACWKTYNASVNQLSLYTYNGNSVKEISSNSTCSSLLIGDFTPHNGEELLLLSLFSTDKEATASLLDLNEAGTELTDLGSTPLDPDVASYTQLQVGNIFEGQVGAVIDGCTSAGEYNTQLLYFNTYFNSLERIYFTENVPYNQALRPYAVLSQDINNDGVIEIPAAFKLSLPKDRTDVAPAADIYWCQQTSTGTVLLMSHQATSLTYGFSLEVPKAWEGKFTALTDYNKNEVTFYEWTKDKLGDELLTIKMFAEYDNEDASDYTPLAETDSYSYCSKIPRSDNILILSFDEVKAAFKLI